MGGHHPAPLSSPAKTHPRTTDLWLLPWDSFPLPFPEIPHPESGYYPVAPIFPSGPDCFSPITNSKSTSFWVAPMTPTEPTQLFLKTLAQLGGSAGNGTLRQTLGWDETTYN